MNRIFESGDLSPVPSVSGNGYRTDFLYRSEEGRGKSPAIYRPTLYEELLFPAEITSDNSGRRDFSGNHIYVLNKYLPNRMGSNTDNLGAVLAWERFFDSPTPNARIRLAGGQHIYRPDGFQTFYVRHNPLGSVSIASDWAFAQSNTLTTPLYLYVTNDLDFKAEERSLFEPVYCHGFLGVEPDSYQSSQIDFYSSRRAAIRRVNVQVEVTSATPIQITIVANALFTEIEEHVIAPAIGVAFNETYTIATELADLITVTVEGGGVATGAAQVSVTYMESEACVCG